MLSADTLDWWWWWWWCMLQRQWSHGSNTALPQIIFWYDDDWLWSQPVLHQGDYVVVEWMTTHLYVIMQLYVICHQLNTVQSTVQLTGHVWHIRHVPAILQWVGDIALFLTVPGWDWRIVTFRHWEPTASVLFIGSHADSTACCQIKTVFNTDSLVIPTFTPPTGTRLDCVNRIGNESRLSVTENFETVLFCPVSKCCGVNRVLSCLNQVSNMQLGHLTNVFIPQTGLDKTVQSLIYWGLLKTVLTCHQFCSHHQQNKTRQSCLVHVGDVN